MKFKLLAVSKIHESALKMAREFAEVDVRLDLTEDQLAGIVGEYDAIMVRSKPKITKRIIDAGRKLRVIGRAGVGLDNVDREAANARGIEVVNSPEASTISVAEHAMGLMLALMRHIPKGHAMVKSGGWDRKMMGNELFGKSLGLVGFGRIGREVAMRAKAFGMKVIAYDPMLTSEDTREYDAELVELDELFKNADVISIHVPALPATKDLVNERTLSLMKPTAIIVNTARGHCIDEEALCKALEENRIRGAALDVYKNEPPAGCPLIALDNVVLVPHFGANTEEGQIEAGKVIVEKIRHILSK
ncbi:MAG: hydroxyacid dehydrogenase [Candidatus Altiarchaeota archaeon]